MSSAFLDTGYVIALEASDDQHHEAAQRHWWRFVKGSPRLVTTSYVFDEVVTFFNSRAGTPKLSRWDAVSFRARASAWYT